MAMPTSSLPPERLRNLMLLYVEAYYGALHQNPDLKHGPVDVPPALLRADEQVVAPIWAEIVASPANAFFRFAAARHALEWSLKIGAQDSVVHSLHHWLGSCVEVGAYSECVRYADAFLALPPHVGHGWRADVIRRKAKALRNMGKFDEALGGYRAALAGLDPNQDHAAIGRDLLLIGKVYGNYLGQRSMFMAILQEVTDRLRRAERMDGGAEDHGLLQYCWTVCLDALGQAHAATDPTRAHAYFTEALARNEAIGRPNGVSRNLCHLARLHFADSDHAERCEQLDMFRRGLELLEQDDAEERGLAIRRLELAEMLSSLGDTTGAQASFDSAWHLARKYSDARTLARVALLSSRIMPSGRDAGEEEMFLEEAATVAAEHRLLLLEVQLNQRRALLRLAGKAAGSPLDLFSRNRAIFLELIGGIRTVRDALENEASRLPEFLLLSPPSQRTLSHTLSLDTERVVEAMDSSMYAAIEAVSINESRRQETLLVGVANAVAAGLVHDIKGVIYGGAADRLAAAAASLKETASSLPVAIDGHPNVIANLEHVADEVSKIGRELTRLGEKLVGLLRRPQQLKDTVKLSRACFRAIDGVKGKLPHVGRVLCHNFSCDIEVISNEDLVVLVIENLLLNAVQDMEQSELTDGAVQISISSIPPDPANRRGRARLTVGGRYGTHARCKDAAERLSGRLLKGGTGKRSGTGVGLDLARLLLIDLLEGEIAVRPTKDKEVLMTADFWTGTTAVSVLPFRGES